MTDKSLCNHADREAILVLAAAVAWHIAKTAYQRSPTEGTATMFRIAQDRMDDTVRRYWEGDA